MLGVIPLQVDDLQVGLSDPQVPGGAGHLEGSGEERGERRKHTRGNEPGHAVVTLKIPHRHTPGGWHKDLSQKP